MLINSRCDLSLCFQAEDGIRDKLVTGVQTCALPISLAEFYFGAGRGMRNLVFLTMGTGLGAGIILDGNIYHGTTDSAGEVGHVRIAEYGPVEYGKVGSWESFCSGAGIAKLAHQIDPQYWPEGTSTQQIVQGALTREPPR